MSPQNCDPHFLDRLRDYYSRHRAFPSYQRLADHLGFASRSAVKKLLERLRNRGYLEQNAHAKWIPSERFFDRSRSLSPVWAGAPDSGGDLSAEPLAVDRWLVQHPSATVLVPVIGDSMIDAGIREGDLAVVERQAHAVPGQLVVALVDGDQTLKEFAVDESGEPLLLPANPAYAPLRPQVSLQICGIVVGIARRYGR